MGAARVEIVEQARLRVERLVLVLGEVIRLNIVAQFEFPRA